MISIKTVKKIDIHVHTMKTPGLPRPGGDNYATPVELCAIYDKIGVERGVLLPELFMECSYDTGSNRETEEIVSLYPDRFSWFCGIDPRQGNNAPDTDFGHFLSYYKSRGACGVGELCASLPFDHPYMMNLFSHCEAHDMPVIFHIGAAGGWDYGIIDDLGLPRMETVLKTFPRLRLIGHSQKFWSHISGDVTQDNWNGYPTGKIVPGGRVVSLMRQYPNLSCDLSAGSGYNAVTRDPAFIYAFFEEFADRIFYGTDICSPRNADSPMLRLASFLDESMEAGHISYETYYKISRGNAEQLLHLK